MSILYSWTFPYFDVAPSEDGLTNVVKTINWRYRLDDGGYFAEVFGSTGLDDPILATFVPYAEITEVWAIEMVTAKTNTEDLQQALTQDIANQKNPPIVQMSVPFAGGGN